MTYFTYIAHRSQIDEHDKIEMTSFWSVLSVKLSKLEKRTSIRLYEVKHEIISQASLRWLRFEKTIRSRADNANF